jgi:hypothetical protein
MLKLGFSGANPMPVTYIVFGVSLNCVIDKSASLIGGNKNIAGKAKKVMKMNLVLS